MIKNNSINKKFWKNKKIFITGHTGFKGSWLTIWLTYLNAKVTGYSNKNNENYFFKKINIKKNYKNIIGDVNNIKLLKKKLVESKAEILIHMAAQPIVNLSYINPLHTLDININGTINVLDCARYSKTIKTILIVTSDKVYENSNSKIIKLNENSNLGGDDIYSASKACADIISHSYFKTYFQKKNIGLATVRAGNVIGGGDWSVNRIFPDIFKSIYLNKKLIIRNQNSSRPWQHVLDCIIRYMILLENLNINPQKYSSSWNIGSRNNKNITIKNILNKFKNNGYKLNYNLSDKNIINEKKIINLSVNKFDKYFKLPNLSFDESFNLTVKWFIKEFENKDTYAITLDQIQEYNSSSDLK